jgi:hypothetical protein
MADNEQLDRLERWADKVLDDSARLPEDLPEDELREHQARWYADFYVSDAGWLIAEPDDPAMRNWLIDEEGMSPELADRVLAMMRELAPAL